MSVHSERPRLDNIDFLRAVAIVAVMLFHYTARFPVEFYRAETVPFRFDVGQYGVELFFVVSGFCIFMTLDSAKSLAGFWSKRLARLQPAYVVGICITMLVLAILPLPGRQTTVAIALSNMLWVNLIPTWPMVDGVYWSLAVELKFYFWIGLIFYLTSGRFVSVAWAGFCLFGVLLESAVWTALPYSGALGVFARLGLISQFAPLFLVGILAYEVPRMSRQLALAVGSVAAILLTFSARYAENTVVVLGIVAAGFAILRMPGLKFPRPITFIGLISYSLYIIHQNVGLTVIRELAPTIPSFTVRLFLAAIFVTLVAWAMFATVEVRWQRPVAAAIKAILDRCFALLPFPRRGPVAPSKAVEVRQW